LGKEGLAADATVATSISLNSSIWVIGPFFPFKEDQKKARTYFHIAAAVTYCTTPEGMFITYIRPLCTQDECISCEPWDISYFYLAKLPIFQEQRKRNQ